MKYIIFNTKTNSIYKVLDKPYMVDGKKGVLPSHLVEMEEKSEKRSLWDRIRKLWA